MAHTSLLRDLLDDREMQDELLSILNIQMATASILAADYDDAPLELPVVGEEQVTFLEESIDRMDADLDTLTSFIIPGGHPAVSQAHVARTVCRRTERTILKLAQEVNIQEDILQFYNRLSDYFFVLSRHISSHYKVRQQPWNPKL